MHSRPLVAGPHPGRNHAPASAIAAALLCACLHGGAGADTGTEPYRLPAATVKREAPRESYQLDPGYRLATEAPPAAPAPAAVPDPRPYAREIEDAAREAGLKPALVHAVVEVESAYRRDAVSPKGAVGLMQLLPETAQRYGVTRLVDVNQNLKAGTRHLKTLIDSFGDRLDLALAAYNAGEGAVRRHRNAIPPYRETRNYVPAVMARIRKDESTVVAEVKKVLAREYMPGVKLEPDALERAR